MKKVPVEERDRDIEIDAFLIEDPDKLQRREKSQINASKYD